MNLDLSNASQKQDEAERHRCVVRLSTTIWANSRGLHTKRSLTYLKRQCVGWNGLQDNTNAVGVEQTLRRITNFNECKDGVYEVVVCNISHDWESGHVDDWEHKLVPVIEAQRSDK